jgi:hypothetical protein
VAVVVVSSTVETVGGSEKRVVRVSEVQVGTEVGRDVIGGLAGWRSERGPWAESERTDGGQRSVDMDAHDGRILVAQGRDIKGTWR